MIRWGDHRLNMGISMGFYGIPSGNLLQFANWKMILWPIEIDY